MEAASERSGRAQHEELVALVEQEKAALAKERRQLKRQAEAPGARGLAHGIIAYIPSLSNDPKVSAYLIFSSFRALRLKPLGHLLLRPFLES